MALNFPGSPAAGQTSQQNGRTYVWNPPAWELVAASGGGGEDALLRSLFVPAAPTGLTATAGNAQVALSWTAPTGVIAQAPITDYREQYSADNGATWTTFTAAASTATSATVTGLTGGTAYTFRVAAINGIGTGAYSTASAAVTPYVAWVPTNLTGLQCWLDASDSTTLFDAGSGGSLPANGGAIGRWLDKAGANHATDVVDGSGATISTQRPTRVASAQNGLDAINFGGTQWFDQNSAREMLRNRSCAIMAVAIKFGTVGNGLNQFAWANRKAGLGEAAIRYQLVHRSANSIAIASRRLDADDTLPIVATETAPPFDTNWHVHVALCDWTNGTLYYRIDGTQIGTASYLSSGNTSDTSLGTAASGTDGGTWTAIGASVRTLRTDDIANCLALSSGSRIGEMICFARTSGSYVTADLQTVEAYLAWRWGLQGNLPSGHPYKSAPPSF